MCFATLSLVKLALRSLQYCTVTVVSLKIYFVIYQKFHLGGAIYGWLWHETTLSFGSHVCVYVCMYVLSESEAHQIYNTTSPIYHNYTWPKSFSIKILQCCSNIISLRTPFLVVKYDTVFIKVKKKKVADSKEKEAKEA